MARTHKVVRDYIHRIIELRKIIIPNLTREVNELGEKLGVGTWRSSHYPGMKVTVGGPTRGGYHTNWKDVVESLARTYDIPQHVIDARASRHQKWHSPTHLTVKVAQDKAKNPKGLVV